jgi:hypothetical protein
MNALESANMNLQTMEAMKRGSEALKNIHGKMCVFPSLSIDLPSPVFRERRRRRLNADSFLCVIVL